MEILFVVVECDACHTRFTTFERVEEVPLLVVKKTVLVNNSLAIRFSTVS